MSKHKQIIVTGPHRSGTTIVTHMIAHDTGKVALDEVVFNHRDIKLIPEILAKEPSCVLQAPQALPWSPILTDIDRAIVYVRRDHAEIEASVLTSRVPKGNLIKRPWFSPDQAFDLWLRVEPLLDHPYVIDYDSIKLHPLYVPKEKRNRKWTHKSIDVKDKKRKRRTDYSKLNRS